MEQNHITGAPVLLLPGPVPSASVEGAAAVGVTERETEIPDPDDVQVPKRKKRKRRCGRPAGSKNGERQHTGRCPRKIYVSDPVADAVSALALKLHTTGAEAADCLIRRGALVSDNMNQTPIRDIPGAGPVSVAFDPVAQKFKITMDRRAPELAALASFDTFADACEALSLVECLHNSK